MTDQKRKVTGKVVSNKHTSRLGRLIVLVAAMALVASACSSGGADTESTTTSSGNSTTTATEAPATTTTTAPATTTTEAPLQKLVLGWTPGAGAPQVAVAIDQGLWKAAGLDVEVVSFPTGREALEALLGGQLDVATLAELPAVTAAMQQQDFGVLSVLSRYRENKVVARRSAGIASLKDLEGKRLGTTLGTNMHFMALEVLDSVGVQAEIVNVPPPDMVTALSRGDIDAMVTFPVFTAQAVDVLGDEYIEFTPGVYDTNFVLGATTEAIDTKSREVQAFLSGLLAGQNVVDTDPATAIEATARVVGENLTPETAKALFDATWFGVVLDNELLDLMVKEGQWMVDSGFVEGDPTPELFRSYLRDDVLSAVYPEGVDLSS